MFEKGQATQAELEDRAEAGRELAQETRENLAGEGCEYKAIGSHPMTSMPTTYRSRAEPKGRVLSADSGSQRIRSWNLS